MRKTGFKGSVCTNRSFGMDAGLNWMSPREEMMKTGGGATWLRKDSCAIYQNTSNTFPVANFRPNWPRIARWRVDTAERSKSNVGNLYHGSALMQFIITVDTPVKASTRSILSYYRPGDDCNTHGLKAAAVFFQPLARAGSIQ